MGHSGGQSIGIGKDRAGRTVGEDWKMKLNRARMSRVVACWRVEPDKERQMSGVQELE